MLGLNPRSHLSLLTLMALLDRPIMSTIPKCQRLKKSADQRRKRVAQKAARRKQRRMH